jgi:hypothetical protein
LTQKRILNNEYKALEDFGITLDGFKSFLSKVLNPESDNNAEGTYDNTKRAVNTSSWENFKKNNRVKKVNIGGSTVHACGWSNFSKSPQIWIDLQSCMIQAAEEMDLTLIYNDVNRSIAVSNKAHEKKPNIAAEGGKSPHNYGVAADICLFANGKIVNFDSDLFKKFANRVKELSNNKIAWGGDWNKTNEKHHFELKDWKVLRDNNELKLIS